jgi:hypothetical protein
MVYTGDGYNRVCVQTGNSNATVVILGLDHCLDLIIVEGGEGDESGQEDEEEHWAQKDKSNIPHVSYTGQLLSRLWADSNLRLRASPGASATWTFILVGG